MRTEEDALNQIERARGRKPKLTDDQVTMAHGSGGKAAAALIQAVFIEAFGAPDGEELRDAAILDLPGTRIAYTTDSYVVQPIRFPGASIGELAVNGTVNDLAVSGARPAWLSAGFILEEGLAMDELRAIAADMRQAADAAGVRIVTGDTKVVPRGAADQVFITTSGIGVIPEERRLGGAQVRQGDRVLISGPIAAHGMAVMIARGNLAISAPIESDSAPVNHWVEAMYAAVEPEAVRWMRDPTRGGLGTVANELARDTELGVLLDEEAIAVAPEVRGACDMLGIDPLYVANEGCFIAVVAADAADAAVAAMRAAGADQASVIGEIIADLPGMVAVRNGFGGTRLMDMLVTDPLPRIC
ncbi:MAG: hydrogenase expression/formation protein HypE [Propionibacteriaceae bacterium]|nr:hydrogenase expression/formation protein HypE [Propionibacteriaceae bacterium]